MTAARVKAAVAEAETIEPTFRFKLVPFGKIPFRRASPYLVKGLMPREGLVVIWGPPKCGKSFWTYDLVMHVALGWEYRGLRVQQGTVVYIACEGEHGLEARTEAYRQAKLAEGAEDGPFYLVTTRLDLIGERDLLIADIRLQIGTASPVAITIDTLNRSIAGSESDDRDMGDYVKAADAVREAFGCAVLLIHHCGVDGTRPRGHTSLTGAADAQLAVKREADGLIVTTVQWLKDGAEGQQVTSRLKVVDLGPDDDGDDLTSCIIVEADAVATPINGVKLSVPCAIALTAMRQAIEEAGVILPASNHVPANTRGVPVELWRKYAYARAITDANTPGAKQKAFKRAAEQLQARGAIGCWSDWVWPTS